MSNIADILSIDMDGSDFDSFGLEDIEILSVSDALALPETGASSAASSCNSSSCCGSSSCFSIN